jgi:hypothetical protein
LALRHPYHAGIEILIIAVGSGSGEYDSLETDQFPLVERKYPFFSPFLNGIWFLHQFRSGAMFLIDDRGAGPNLAAAVRPKDFDAASRHQCEHLVLP